MELKQFRDLMATINRRRIEASSIAECEQWDSISGPERSKAFISISILLSASMVLCGCRVVTSLPQITMPSTDEVSISPITSWRIVGPFRLPEAYQGVYTPQTMEAAFFTDYLNTIGGSEAPLRIGEPTTSEQPSFDHDPNDEPDFDSQTLRFYNQNVNFPIPAVDSQVLFRKPGEFFKVMYAASRIVSAVPKDVFLVVTGDSPMKLWINDKVVVMPRADSVGHDPTVDHIVQVHLHSGENTLLIKMFCFPQRNNVAVSIADRSGAKAFVHEHGGLLDLIDQVMVPVGKTLVLSENLRLYAGKSAANVSIENFKHNVVRSEALNLSEELAVPTDGLSSGLYSIHIRTDNEEFAEPFFLGNKEQLIVAYKARARQNPQGGSFGYREALQGLQKELDNQDASFRLGHQKVTVFLASLLASSFANSPEWKQQPQLGAFSYVSKVDTQEQDLLLHLPDTYNPRQPIPLVLVVPHNTPPRSKIVGRSGSDINMMEELSNLSDEFHFATAWLHVRGLVYDSPLAFTDTREAIQAIEKRYNIDRSRIYLLGDCGGGVNVLALGEAMPDQFAALGLVNPVIHFRVALPESAYWEKLRDPTNSLANLRDLPVQMVHFVNFPHSPIVQSEELQKAFNNLNIHPDLIPLHGNGWGSDRDPWRLSFEFFRNKKKPSNPRTEDFTARQSKVESSPLSVKPEFRASASNAPKSTNSSMAGPISNAFASAFVVVQGSAGSADDRANSKSTCDQIANVWQTTYGEPLRRKMDVQITLTDIKDSNLILIGTKQSNRILQKIWVQLPVTMASNRVSVGGEDVEGRNLSIVMVYPNPVNRQRYVVVITSNGDAPIKIPDFNLASSGKYDVGIWSSLGTQTDLVTYGYWDKTWEQLRRPPDENTSPL